MAAGAVPTAQKNFQEKQKYPLQFFGPVVYFFHDENQIVQIQSLSSRLSFNASRRTAKDCGSKILHPRFESFESSIHG